MPRCPLGGLPEAESSTLSGADTGAQAGEEREVQMFIPGAIQVDKLTDYQYKFLKDNDHLAAVSFLDDGDVLVLDLVAARERPEGHFGPYVLTGEGKLQLVNYHYAVGHQLKEVPFAGGWRRMQEVLRHNNVDVTALYVSRWAVPEGEMPAPSVIE